MGECKGERRQERAGCEVGRGRVYGREARVVRERKDGWIEGMMDECVN